MSINLGEIFFGVSPDLSRMDAASHKLTGFTGLLSRLGSVSVLVNGPLGGIAARMSVLASLVNRGNIAIAGFALGAAAAATVITRLGSSAVETAKQMQGLTMAFTAIQGDKVGAAGQLNWVKDLADLTGSNFVEMAHSWASFAAAVKGTALEGDQAREVFKQISFAASTLGLSVDDTTGTLRAFGQMLSKGTVQAEELRGQLGDRLYGAFQQAAIAMGMSTQKLNAELKKGNIQAVDFVKKFAAQYTQSLGIDVTKAIETVVASENRLGNAFFFFSRKADESIGFSRAYQNGLETLTNVINSLAENMDFIIPRIVAVGGALLGLVAPQILTGVVALLGLIKNLTAGFFALNLVLLANPITGLLALFIRLGLVVGGAIGAYAAFTSVFNANTAAINGDGQKAINNYIASQVTLKASVHATTEEYIRQQEAIMESVSSQLRSAFIAKGSAEDMLDAASAGMAGSTGSDPWSKFVHGANEKAFTDAQGQITNLDTTIASLSKQVDEAFKSYTKLKEIVAKPELTSSNNNDDAAAILNKAGKAAREAQEAVNDLGLKYNNLFKSDAQRDWDTMQDKLNKDIVNFGEKLTDAGLSSEVAAQLTNQYAAALKQVEGAAWVAERSLSVFEIAQQSIGAGLDSWSQQFVDDVMNGEDALKSLADTARNVANDILKTLLQLTVSNPLKNFLFDMGAPTLGGFTSGGGSGGWLGKALQAVGGMFGVAHGGGVIGGGVNSRSRLPLSIPTLHTGMRADEQLVKMQNGERVIARGAHNNSDKPNFHLNLINQTGQKQTAEAQGDPRFDGEKWVQDVVLKVIGGGQADSSMQRYNLKPGILRRPFAGRTQ